MMLRGILLIFLGIGATINGISVFGKEPSDIEKTGWVYQNYGSNGISIGLALLGVVMFLIGFSMVRSEWRLYKQGKNISLDI
jgi:hypothetical protein